MKLSELLGEAQVLVGFRARDKWEALGGILDALAASGRIPAHRRRAVHEALVARENVSSTGMEHGVALPHASVDGLEEAAAALAIAPEGIPFRSADGQPARLIALLAIPRGAVQTHIRTLAGIARVLSSEETREALLAARSAGEVLRLIREKESESHKPEA